MFQNGAGVGEIANLRIGDRCAQLSRSEKKEGTDCKWSRAVAGGHDGCHWVALVSTPEHSDAVILFSGENSWFFFVEFCREKSVFCADEIDPQIGRNRGLLPRKRCSRSLTRVQQVRLIPRTIQHPDPDSGPFKLVARATRKADKLPEKRRRRLRGPSRRYWRNGGVSRPGGEEGKECEPCKEEEEASRRRINRTAHGCEVPAN